MIFTKNTKAKLTATIRTPLLELLGSLKEFENKIKKTVMFQFENVCPEAKIINRIARNCLPFIFQCRLVKELTKSS